jgi:hydrogenase expression/formation protein HypC
MCLTMPARVIAVDGAWAEVEIGELRRTVSILVSPDVRPGDWGLVAAGTLVRTLDPDVAQQIAAAVRLATTHDDDLTQGADA